MLNRTQLRSFKILEEEFPSIYSELPNKEMIKNAIENHSIGKGLSAKESEKICLRLLMILDHMDALGEEGIKRDFRDLDFDVPIFPMNTDYNPKSNYKDNIMNMPQNYPQRKVS